MHIDPKTNIAGLPALEARDVMKKLSCFVGGFSVERFSKYFDVSLETAKKRIAVFEAESYLERFTGEGSKQQWRLPIKGQALAQANAAKRVKRSTADRHYRALMKRVQEVNENDEYLLQISKVALFGSYISEHDETVSTIDVFIWLQKKPKFEINFREVCSQRTEQMTANGRIFSDFGKLANWPELDIRKHLKSGSKVIKIQGLNCAYEFFNCRVVFDSSVIRLEDKSIFIDHKPNRI